MNKQFSIAEAKNRLPALVHSTDEGVAIELTRRGKPVAVLISIRDYERLTRQQEGFWSALESFRRRQPESQESVITDADFSGLRDRSPGRGEPW